MSIKRPIKIRLIWPFLFLFYLLNIELVLPSSIDSLKSRLYSEKNESIRVDLFNSVSSVLWLSNASDLKLQAYKYSDSALALSKKINYQGGLARSLYLIGKYSVNDRAFEKATSFLLQSLSVYEKIGDANGKADCHLQLGVISYSLQNYPEAQNHLKKCIANISIRASLLTVGRYLLAICLSETDSIKSARENFNIALSDYIAKNDTIGMIQSYTYLGKMYMNTKEYGKALQMLRLAISLGMYNENHRPNLMRSYCFLSTLYLNLNKIDTAIYYGELSLKNADWLTNKEALATLSESYSRKGNYKNAFQYLKKLKMLSDSVYSSNIINSTAELRSRFEFKNQLSQQKEEQYRISAKQKSDFEKQKLIRNSMLFISVLVIVLLLVFLNRFRLKQKHSEELTLAYNDLKRTQEQLVQQEKLASLGSLTAGIAHEIKNPLNFVTNFSQLSMELIDELLSSESESDRAEISVDLKSNLQKINQHANRADSIVQGMLQHARNSSEKMELADVNAICAEYVDLAYHALRSKVSDFNFELKKSFNPSLPLVNMIKVDISRVILNLVNNALYAVRKKRDLLTTNEDENKNKAYVPTVVVSTSVKNSNVIISVKDNGTGIPKEIRQKIFEPFFTTKPSGEGTGLGLSICFDIIKAHGGEMKVESEENEFTDFIISLPV